MATSKKKKSTNLAEQISKDIARVAEEVGVPAYALSKSQYCKNDPQYSEWDMRKVGGFAGIKNTFFENTEIRNEVEVAELKELRAQFRELRQDFGDMDLLVKKVKDAVSEIPVLKLKPYQPSKATAKAKADPRTLNVLLSDLHFGSDLKIDEHGKNFGKIEEARALARIVSNVCTYKLQYRDQTELVVNILGDVIENQLHGAGPADLLHMQACRAMYLLSQAIGRFSENFPKVRVNFAVGNHGRDTSIHEKRATEQKYNALETTIYYGVKLACKNLTNVMFNQPKTPWITYDAQGHKVYCTHGDTHLNPGNPGGKIDTKSLENQTNKINAALSDDEEFAVFAMGHVHQAMVTVLSNGAFLITNGALVPPNGFAQSINVVECQQIQIMWESTKKFAVGDFRFINVTDTEASEELDAIIKPFEDLNAP